MALAVAVFVAMHASMLAPHFSSPHVYMTSIKGLTSAIADAKPPQAELEAVLPVSYSDRGILLRAVDAGSLNLTGLGGVIEETEAFFARRALPGTLAIEGMLRLPGEQRAEAPREGVRLTARSDYYNAFDIDRPVVGHYYWIVKRAFHQYARSEGVRLDVPYWIHGWFNCFRGGNNINLHGHGSVIAGNVAVHIPPKSFTHYAGVHRRDWVRVAGTPQWYLKDAWRPLRWAHPPYAEALELTNTPGQLVLFNGFALHRSSNVTEEQRRWLGERGATDCRMTAAFDISRSPVGWHSVPLYDPRDPWWKADPRADWAAALGDRLADLFRAHEVPAIFSEQPGRSPKAFRAVFEEERRSGVARRAALDQFRREYATLFPATRVRHGRAPEAPTRPAPAGARARGRGRAAQGRARGGRGGPRGRATPAWRQQTASKRRLSDL